MVRLCRNRAVARVRRSASLLLHGLLLASAFQLQAAAPAITNQPSSQTIFYGSSVTFAVGASGTAPLAFQWYRDGARLSGATSSAYSLATVLSNDSGAGFVATVTNSSGAATSQVAVLSVDLGITGSQQVTQLLSFASTWAYNQTGTNIGTSWMQVGYNDTQLGWLSGLEVFDAKWLNGSPTNRLTVAGLPIGTVLNMKPFGTNACTFYFRTHFNVPSSIAQFVNPVLQATTVIDDGAAFYLNGQEAFRLGVTNTAWNAWATRTVNDPALEYFNLPLTNVTAGDNVVAAEVHQVNSGSSDITFGFTLDLSYYPRLRDTNAPVVSQILPQPGTVASFTQLEVDFSEGVQGVRAADLLIAGVAATGVTAYGSDIYIFSFPQPPVGLVSVSWSPSQRITDLTANSNRFAGGSYSYTLDPSAIASNVRINEFMAGNTHTIADDDGHFSDWLELFNSGDSAVDIGRWYLTDNPTRLTKWQIPRGVTMPGKSYLLIWASGNDRTNPAAPLHTNFKLDKAAGNFLGLVYSNGVSVISTFANYPQQYDDVSYGRDRVDPSIIGYFTNATPGAANATVGANFAPAVSFSRASGTFQQSFNLSLGLAGSNAVIRYFLVTNAASAALTNVPNASCPLYSGPLSITTNIQVRARAFSTLPNFWPGPPASATYVQLTPGAAAFSSSAPLFLFCNFNAGKPPATADQVGVMMVFGTAFGRACLTNPPDLVARMGFNIRGRSTQNNPQSSYAVETWDEFNEPLKVDLLGLPAESDWVFYAPDYFDKPLIHNPFMHELSRRIGRYSSNVRMVELFTNYNGGPIYYTAAPIGNYYGTYVLEEKIKADPGRVDIPKLDPNETNYPAITGGYMLKNDSANPDERTLYAANQSMVYVEPKMTDYYSYSGRALQEAYISDYFNNFYNSLFSPNWADPVTGYAAWIDVDSWIDHHILEVLSLNADALRLSAYFFKDRNKRIAMGPLWDFDRSLGTSAGDWRPWNPRTWMSSNPLGSPTSTDYGTDYFNPGSVFANPWYSILFYDPDFWQKWIDRWQQLRQDAFSTDSLFAIIEMFTNQVAEAQPRQSTRWAGSGASDTTPRSGFWSVPGGWPDTSFTHSFPGTYQGEIDFMRIWLAYRLEFIDTNFLTLPLLSSAGGVITQGFALTVSAPRAEPGTTTYYTLDGSDPRLAGGAISPFALAANAPFVLTLNGNARVCARNWNPSHQNLTGPGNPPLSSPWSGLAAATYVVSTPPLVITEIMYHPAPPASGTNAAGDFEFIELKNVGAQPLLLPGFRFTKGIDFTFTATNAITSLSPGQYVVLVKNLAAFQARYPAVTNVAGQYDGSLNNSGERLYLEGPLREPILDFAYNDGTYPTTDGPGFSLVIRNEFAPFSSWANPAGWRPSTAINGSPGGSDPVPGSIPAILINEALTHTDPPQSDTIELFNPTANPAPIGGWFLTDDRQQPLKYRIPTNTIIAAGGFALFDESQFNTGSNAFALSSLGEEVYLYSGDGTNLTGYSHGFKFGAQHNGVTFGRYVTSDGKEHFVLQKANSLGAPNAGPKVGPVILNEIMYSPPKLGLDTDTLDEYIELRNFSGQAAPLYDPLHTTNAWRLDGGIQFTFPLGVTMPPHSYLLVVSFDPIGDPVSLNWFTNRYRLPPSTPIYGPYQGHLGNQGDHVQLLEPDKPEIPPSPVAGFVPYVLLEEVHYSPLPPWPANADATGNSLQRVAAIGFADDPINWTAGPPNPGALNPASVTADSDNDGLPDEWEIANGLDPLDSTGANGALGDPDSDRFNNWQEYLAGTSPTNRLDFLDFDSVTVSGSFCILQFTPRAGRTYTVEKLDTFGNAWSTYAANITGTNLVTLFDPLSTARFYRLKVSLSP